MVSDFYNSRTLSYAYCFQSQKMVSVSLFLHHSNYEKLNSEFKRLKFQNFHVFNFFPCFELRLKDTRCCVSFERCVI